MDKATVQIQIPLESYKIKDLKNVHSFLMAQAIRIAFNNLKTALENFTNVKKIVNNFWQNDDTEKPKKNLESRYTEAFKYVCAFSVRSFYQKLLAFKVSSNVLIIRCISKIKHSSSYIGPRVITSVRIPCSPLFRVECRRGTRAGGGDLMKWWWSSMAEFRRGITGSIRGERDSSGAWKVQASLEANLWPSEAQDKTL